MKGKAQTVLGLIDGSELGITLPHEHFFADQRASLMKPSHPQYVTLAMTPADDEEEELVHQRLRWRICGLPGLIDGLAKTT